MKAICTSVFSAAFLGLLVPGVSGDAGGPIVPPPEYGPAKGTLVIIGGGSTANTGIVEKFIELAGGRDAKFVIVPTAAGNKTADGKTKAYREENVVASWKKRGLSHVRMLHTHDPGVADTAEFVKPLKDANAVWLSLIHI